MTPPTWHYVKHGRSSIGGAAAWLFQSDDGLEIAVPWNWRGFRSLGEAESFLNTYVRLLEDRPVAFHRDLEATGPVVNWHPSAGPAVTCDQAERRITVL